MILLFFNYKGSLKDVSETVFASLGISNVAEGDSSNVLDGVYYTAAIFGVNLKIELNAYDHEDKYTYMLSLRKDLPGAVTADDKVIRMIGEATKRLLFIKLSLSVAEEKNGSLDVYSMCDPQPDEDL